MKNNPVRMVDGKRVWGVLEDIPDDVQVVTNKWGSEVWPWEPSAEWIDNITGPFTEVIK